MYRNAIEYLDSIDETDDVLIVTHWDMDGSSSAAITSLILEESRGSGAEHVITPAGRKHQLGSDTEDLLEQGVNKLIVLDMSVPSSRVDELTSEYDIDMLIIDHHGFDQEPDNAVFVNPRTHDPDAYIPASKLCNDIAKKFGIDTDWIAGLGIVQDFGAEQVMGLFKRLKKIHPNYFPATLSQSTLAKRCRYGRISSVMNVKPYKDTQYCAELAFHALTDAKNLEYLETHKAYKELEAYHQEVSEEIERIKNGFDEDKEVYEDEKLVFYQFSSPHHINSSIATQVSLDDEDWVFILAKVTEDEVNVSSRCQSGRVDLGSLMQQAIPDDAGPEAEGGGHSKAAGASFRPELLESFKHNLLELL